MLNRDSEETADDDEVLEDDDEDDNEQEKQLSIELLSSTRELIGTNKPVSSNKLMGSSIKSSSGTDIFIGHLDGSKPLLDDDEFSSETEFGQEKSEDIITGGGVGVNIPDFSSDIFAAAPFKRPKKKSTEKKSQYSHDVSDAGLKLIETGTSASDEIDEEVARILKAQVAKDNLPGIEDLFGSKPFDGSNVKQIEDVHKLEQEHKLQQEQFSSSNYEQQQKQFPQIPQQTIPQHQLHQQQTQNIQSQVHHQQPQQQQFIQQSVDEQHEMLKEQFERLLIQQQKLQQEQQKINQQKAALNKQSSLNQNQDLFGATPFTDSLGGAPGIPLQKGPTKPIVPPKKVLPTTIASATGATTIPSSHASEHQIVSSQNFSSSESSSISSLIS